MTLYSVSIVKLVTYIPAPISPEGTIFTDTPKCKWSPLPTATPYEVHLVKDSIEIFSEKLTKEKVCNNTVCVYRPLRVMAEGDYEWRVRAMLEGEWKAW